MSILLSSQLGRQVVTPDGAVLGRVVDLSVRLGPAHPEVHRVLVREHRSSGFLVPHPALVTTATDLEVRQWPDAVARAVDLRHLPLEDGELLLWRDVVDTQVVDLRGRHLSRVSDVLLERVGEHLEVPAVDLGTAGLLHRVGLGRLDRRGSVLAAEWSDLHLTSRRGHLVQLSADAAAFRHLDDAGLAELLTRLSTPDATDVIRAVEPEHAAAALHRSHPTIARRLVRELGTADRRRLLAEARDEHVETLTRLDRDVATPARRRWRRTEGWRLHRPTGG
jgi:sporulation protein YlmC with PRC-barrel domain